MNQSASFETEAFIPYMLLIWYLIYQDRYILNPRNHRTKTCYLSWIGDFLKQKSCLVVLILYCYCNYSSYGCYGIPVHKKLHWLLENMFRLTTKKSLMVRITGCLWGQGPFDYMSVLVQVMSSYKLPVLLNDAYICVARLEWVNSSSPGQNGCQFADDIFKFIYVIEEVCILIKISLNFVPMGPIDSKPALVQIMAWHRPGDKPLSEPMVVRLPTHICITRPIWVKHWLGYHVIRHIWYISSHKPE